MENEIVQDDINDLREISVTVQQWQALYESMGVNVDLTSIEIPQQKEGFNRLVLVAQGVTAQQVFDHCASIFPCCNYTGRSLDTSFPVNDRTSSGSYAVWLRDRREANEDLTDISANVLKASGILGVTLLERLLLEVKYFTETGKHLDIESITKCAGSRDSDGDVPSAGWRGGALSVDWCSADARGSFRQVVS